MSFVMHTLETVLRLEVSAKKSVTVAGSFKFAKKLTRKLRTSKISAVRRSKLLGTDATGGRKR